MSRSDPSQPIASAAPVSASFLALEQSRRDLVLKLADEMIESLLAAEKEMVRKLDAARLDLDEELALWGVLPSKVRTAIKRGRGEAA